MKDKRNFLYKELLRVMADKKPKFFMAENVKGILSMENGKVIDMIINDFKSLGYDIEYRILNAAEYGVPQARERVIIMGNRIGARNPYPEKERFVEGFTEEKYRNMLPPAITTEQAKRYDYGNRARDTCE
jgi:DNA (cytosine-5)-methyltransferase 1